MAQRLAGRQYQARLASGTVWDMHYGADGGIQMKISNGQSDQGRWRAEDNRLCIDFAGTFPSGCSEVRLMADQLYLKRTSTGEVVSLVVKP